MEGFTEYGKGSCVWGFSAPKSKAPPVVHFEQENIIHRQPERVGEIIRKIPFKNPILAESRLRPDKIERASRKVLPTEDDVRIQHLLIEIKTLEVDAVEKVKVRKLVRSRQPLEMLVCPFCQQDLCEELEAHAPREGYLSPQ